MQTGCRAHLLEVRYQRVLQVTYATLVSGGLDPGQVAELGVHGHTQDLSVHGLEVIVGICT